MTLDVPSAAVADVFASADGVHVVHAGEAAPAPVWRGAPVLLQGDGTVLWQGKPLDLPCPAVDVAADGSELRVACLFEAVRWDRSQRVVHVPAVAAGPLWGGADGELWTDDGALVGTVDGAVAGTARDVDGDVVVGTDRGLYRVHDGQIDVVDAPTCSPFVTGLTKWRGHLVAATFDGGVCVEEDGQWTPIPGLPPMTNDVLAQGDVLWVATSDGLARVVAPAGIASAPVAPGGLAGGTFVVTLTGEVTPDAPKGSPGLNHPGANALAKGRDGLWVADVLGPVRVGSTWTRYRWSVTGHSYDAIAACADGTVWAGSEDDGLAVRGVTFGAPNGRSSWRHVDVLSGLPEDWVMAVACAGPQSAWVGTYRHGVGRVDVDGWHPVAGLEDAWVQALAVDGDVLWVGTADGLYRVDGDAVEQVADGDVQALLIDGAVVRAGTTAGVVAVGR